MIYLLSSMPTDTKLKNRGATMKRKALSKNHSRRSFKAASGHHKLNGVNPRKMRGGLRL